MPARSYVIALILMMAGVIAATEGYAATSTVTVTATVLSKNTCRFTTTAGAIAFGTLTLGNPDQTIPATLTYRCQGSTPLATFLITDDDGLYETGVNANRMQNTATLVDYLPYELSYSPTSATVPRNTNQTLSLTAVIRAANIAAAAQGAYSDTVTLTINP